MNSGQPADPELSARAAQFIYAYARAVDRGDLATLRSLLADDIHLTRADGTQTGPDAFMTVYEFLAREPAKTRTHACTNISAFQEPDGLVRVEAYFQATVFDQAETQITFGRYDDTLRETPSGFQFVHKRNIIERIIVLPASGK